MEMHRVSSSNIHSIGYDEAHLKMQVKFHSGALYEYSNVQLRRYELFMTSISKGRYFDEYIKEKYPCRKLSG